MQDTSPIFGRSERIKRMIKIEELNDPPMPNTFDTTVEYASDSLPEWFQGLQSVVEDAGFTGMVITLGGNRRGGGITRYHLSAIETDIERYNRERDERERRAKLGIEKPWLPVYDGE